MKKIYILVILASITLKASIFAQELPYFGVSGGDTWASGVFTSLHNFTYTPVHHAGIFAEFDRLDHLYMNAGFTYSQEETGPVTLRPEVKKPVDFTSNIMYDYVDIYGKLKWSYQIVKHVNAYYTGGIYAGYLFYGSYTDDNKTIFSTTSMHRANGGLMGGVGLTFQISKLKIDLGAQANYGFFYTIKDLPYRGTFYAAGVSGVLGISYPIDLE
jgi:hypothetical protein